MKMKNEEEEYEEFFSLFKYFHFWLIKTLERAHFKSIWIFYSYSSSFFSLKLAKKVRDHGYEDHKLNVADDFRTQVSIYRIIFFTR